MNNRVSIHQLKEGAEVITSTLYIAERLNLWFVKQPLELLRNLPSNTTSQFPCKYIKDLTNGVNMAQFTIPHITKDWGTAETHAIPQGYRIWWTCRKDTDNSCPCNLLAAESTDKSLHWYRYFPFSVGNCQSYAHLQGAKRQRWQEQL